MPGCGPSCTLSGTTRTITNLYFICNCNDNRAPAPVAGSPVVPPSAMPMLLGRYGRHAGSYTVAKVYASTHKKRAFWRKNLPNEM